MRSLFTKKEEDKLKIYFCIRRVTNIENYGTGDEEIGDSTVKLAGVFDYEHARKCIDKDFDFDTYCMGKVTIIRRNDEGYKLVLRYSDKYQLLIEEYFDYTWINRAIHQPIFEEACITTH